MRFKYSLISASTHPTRRGPSFRRLGNAPAASSLRRLFCEYGTPRARTSSKLKKTIVVTPMQKARELAGRWLIVMGIGRESVFDALSAINQMIAYLVPSNQQAHRVSLAAKCRSSALWCLPSDYAKNEHGRL